MKAIDCRYVIDTSYWINHFEYLQHASRMYIVIPDAVLAELDGLMKNDDERAALCETIHTWMMCRFSEDDKLETAPTILRQKTDFRKNKPQKFLALFEDVTLPDNYVIYDAYLEMQKYGAEKVILLSSDVPQIHKAKRIGLQAKNPHSIKEYMKNDMACIVHHRDIHGHSAKQMRSLEHIDFFVPESFLTRIKSFRKKSAFESMKTSLECLDRYTNLEIGNISALSLGIGQEEAELYEELCGKRCEATTRIYFRAVQLYRKKFYKKVYLISKSMKSEKSDESPIRIFSSFREFEQFAENL